MYIIAIGWLYVTVLVALNEPTVIYGIISFMFYGLLPSGILFWLAGRKVRRQRRRYQESLANQRADTGNRSDTEADQ
jgi:hypothetical protein